MEGEQPRINSNHLKPSANTGSEREEPKVRYQENTRRLDHQTAGTAQRKPEQGKESTSKRREEPRQDRCLLTHVLTNAQGRNPRRERRGCGQRIRRQDGATELQRSPKPRSCRRGHRPVTKPPQPQIRRRTSRDMKRWTNHEGQSRPQTSQPTDTGDTAVQKHTHPKVRESKQGDNTVDQRADTTPTGAP